MATHLSYHDLFLFYSLCTDYHRAIILHGGSNGINKEVHKHSAWMKTINMKENVSKNGQSPFFGTHVGNTQAPH